MDNKTRVIVNNHQKKNLLKGKSGGYFPVSNKLHREVLPELVKKHKGRDARDVITLYLYYQSYVSGDEEKELYGFAWPSISKIARDTGIDKNRLKKLNLILQNEGLVRVEKRLSNGHVKNVYMPIYQS